MAASAENVANELIGRLEQAWNEADGRAFGEPFSTDADFVDIRGDRQRNAHPRARSCGCLSRSSVA
jgi:hypothetical protein